MHRSQKKHLLNKYIVIVVNISLGMAASFPSCRSRTEMKRGEEEGWNEEILSDLTVISNPQPELVL